MIEQLKLAPETNALMLASEVVYLEKPYWLNCGYRTLKLSVIAPRVYYTYDLPVKPRPCLLFLCGGGFMKQDRMAWLPELMYFAENGYVVATADYSVLPYTEFPQPLIEIKNAIRYLRAHAAQFHIDPDRIAVSGESAGGQLASWVATTNGCSEYEEGTCLDQRSDVQCCVPWYPVINIHTMPHDGIRVRTDNFPDTCQLITPDTPPFFIIHGTSDTQVTHEQSLRFHEHMTRSGRECTLLLLEGSDHADALCYRTEVKERILEFLNRHLKA